MSWRRQIEPMVRPFFFRWARATRGLTLGVRGLVTNAAGEVLLIEHTYVHGWFMPGGGVERGETCEQAVHRELVEEAGILSTGRPRLLSLHSNEPRFPGDHVLVYHVETYTHCQPTSRGEISRMGWFGVNDLPQGVTDGTRSRIEEALAGRPSDVFW